jgi:D-alanyl-D-alanine carboxypeptidase (penicillin-binding protein 5/6)
MRLSRSRWTIAGIGAVVVIVLTTMLLIRPSGPPAAARVATHRVVAGDSRKAPWYGLHLLQDHLDFTGDPSAVPPPNTAVAGILVDLDTHRILWQRNPHEQLPPASTIKLLTSMVVLQNFSPNQLITATPDALFTAGDETKMHIDPGEKLTVQELMTGLLMVSANDAADVLAVKTVGMERFVGAMNAQAAALGLRDTHATSPVGLDDPDMHSSAYDLAVLAALDYKHWPLFRNIVATEHTVLPASDLHGLFDLTNVNELLTLYPAAVGIKTGYTGDAGDCLVGMAVRDGHRLLTVVLGVPTLVFTQTRQLLDWGFTQEGLPSQLPPSAHPPGAPPA